MLVKLLGMDVLKVAGEYDHVGVQGIDAVYGPLEYPLTAFGV